MMNDLPDPQDLMIGSRKGRSLGRRDAPRSSPDFMFACHLKPSVTKQYSFLMHLASSFPPTRGVWPPISATSPDL